MIAHPRPTTLPPPYYAAPAYAHPPVSKARPAYRAILLALYLGWSVDALFYNKALGVSAPVFVAGLLAALFILSRLEGVRPDRRNLWLHAALLVYSSMIPLRANPSLTLLNITVCGVLLCLVAHFHAGGRVPRLTCPAYLAVAANSIGHAVILPFGHLANIHASRKASSRPVPYLLPVLRGLLIAAPILLLFALLLSSADIVFAHLLGGLLDLSFLNLADLTTRAIIIGLASWILLGGLLYALSRPGDSPGPWQGAHAKQSMVGLHIGSVESLTVLALVDALFVFFGYVQFAYLFGGQANISVEGFTYADYARRGFFELVAVTVLTLGLMLFLHYHSPRPEPRQARPFNALCAAMLLLVLLLLASAFRRMSLYESAYGYTELRLYVYLAMFAIAALFLWLGAVIFARAPFGIGAFVIFLLFGLTLNAINPDRFVAERNFSRYRQTSQIDLDYLRGLSDDAVPVLLQIEPELIPQDAITLTYDLNRRLEKLRASRSHLEWPEFHFARDEAYRTLLGQ